MMIVDDGGGWWVKNGRKSDDVINGRPLSCNWYEKAFTYVFFNAPRR